MFDLARLGQHVVQFNMPKPTIIGQNQHRAGRHKNGPPLFNANAANFSGFHRGALPAELYDQLKKSVNESGNTRNYRDKSADRQCNRKTKRQAEQDRKNCIHNVPGIIVVAVIRWRIGVITHSRKPA
jgi:hypothetical protein